MHGPIKHGLATPRDR